MKYLITGANGKLGSQLRGKLNAVYPSKAEMDILQLHDLHNWLERSGADAILHLAAISDTAWAEKNKLSSYQTNVIGTANVSRIAHDFQKKIIFMSTDYIFPGIEGKYREEDKPSPSNWYGFTKLAGEQEILSRNKEHLIIRTAFRPTKWPFATAYEDVYTSGDYVDIIADEILLALKLNLGGVIHIGTPKKTLLELAQKRNPEVTGVEAPAEFPKRKDLSIDKWLKIKQQASLSN